MKKIILTFLLLILFSSNSFANELEFNDETKTIRELKENIEELDKNKTELKTKTKDFAPSEILKKYFRKDLNIDDVDEIRKIISNYNKRKKDLENHLYVASKKLIDTKEIKIKLLEEKKDLYKRLTPFIKISNYNEYLQYIKSDTSLYSEKKEIDSDIIRKKEIINNKVEFLEEKIKRHKSYIEDNLQKLIEKKLEEKINELSSNPEFLILSLENKKRVVDKTIFKIKNRISDLYEENNSESITLYKVSLNQKKIEIYEITFQKLEDFKLSLKE